MSNLSIYKASAGSGKTYTLALEFIKLALSQEFKYKTILAVTFTNKATAEMKTRMIKELGEIAYGSDSNYISELKSYFGVSEDEIIETAKVVLNNILHDYGQMSVSTIDTFFQNIIRSFTYETGMQAGYKLILEQDEILEEMVNTLIFDIDEYPETKAWLKDYALENISEGKSWNFRADLLKFGKQLFNEKFRQRGEELLLKVGDKDFINKYKSSLRSIIDEHDKTMIDFGNKGLLQIQNSGLTIDDFSYKKAGPVGLFPKLIAKDYEFGTRIVQASLDHDKWYSKTSKKKDEIIGLLDSGLLDIFQKALFCAAENKQKYNTAKLILSSFNALGAISDMLRILKESNSEQNRFLISDSSLFINRIIEDNPTPFIYEKTGNKYHHFLLDEFQDVSVVQWKNFAPLLNNGLSLGDSSLIVGDVKQSIYRWRNSDWKILGSHVNEEFANMGVVNKILKTNWRSSEVIIRFNNSIFSKMRELVSNLIETEIAELLDDNEGSKLKDLFNEAYSDIAQDFSENSDNQGKVKIDLIDSEDTKMESIARIPGYIEELQDRGCKPSDTAIIVRGNKDAADIAEYMIKYKESDEARKGYNYNVISSEALRIGASPAVTFIVSVLKYIFNPADKVNVAYINSYYSQKQIEDYDKHDVFSNKMLLPYISSIVDSISKLPLFELHSEIIKKFELTSKADLVYLDAFSEYIFGFESNDGSNLGLFLERWEAEGCTKSIAAPEIDDAITIITIHKSKGLEFGAVIMPICDWSILPKPDIMWAESLIEPFNALPLIPVKYGKLMSQSYFVNNHINEKVSTYIDNINMLYVAFTRAVHTLYIAIPDKPDKNTGKVFSLIRKSVEDYSQEDSSVYYTTEDWAEARSGDEYFNINKTSGSIAEKTVKDSSTIVIESVEGQSNLRANLRIPDATLNASGEVSMREYGNFMHSIFQNISTLDSVESTLDNLVAKGTISKEEKKQIGLVVKKYLTQDGVADWFDSRWEITSERDLLYGNSVFRPDRVISTEKETIVIDFKFGKVKKDSYKKQVKTYIQLLTQMGKENVTGYLWYPNLNTTEMIKIEKPLL